MSRSHFVAGLLFWFMVLTGGAALVPCLILPAWSEYHSALTARLRAAERVARMEAQLVAVEKRIEHLQEDPAYLERLARKELGIPIPGVEELLVSWTAASDSEGSPLPAPASDATDAAGAASGDEGIVPTASRWIALAMERVPLLEICVRPQTRPYVMSLSGVLLVSAIMLLGIPRRAESSVARA